MTDEAKPDTATPASSAPEHHPALFSAGRQGYGYRCACGWESRPSTTIPRARIDLGKHLAEVSR